jgi:formylglycine-generating enzyme required for sulfatase activity
LIIRDSLYFDIMDLGGSMRYVCQFILCQLVVIFPCFSLTSISMDLLDQNDLQAGIYKKSYALMIGVDDYIHWPDLHGVKEEIDSVSKAFEKHGFEIIKVMNPDFETLSKELKNFVVKYGADEKNRLVIYFAGHGESVPPKWGGDPMGYLVAKDSPKSTDRQAFKLKSISMDRLQTLARQIECKHAMFIFDCCYSGAVLFSMNRSIPKYISQKALEPVRMFITAGKEDQQVPDQSLFSKVLIDGLEGGADFGGDGYITGLELGEYIHNRVVDLTNKAQTPMYGRMRDRVLSQGDFVFVSPKKSEKSALSSVIQRIEQNLVNVLLEPDPVVLHLIDTECAKLKSLGASETVLKEISAKIQKVKQRISYQKSKVTVIADNPNVEVTVKTNPKWVYVYDADGKYLGNTKSDGKLILERPKGETLVLSFKKVGYQASLHEISFSDSGSVPIVLDKISKKKSKSVAVAEVKPVVVKDTPIVQTVSDSPQIKEPLQKGRREVLRRFDGIDFVWIPPGEFRLKTKDKDKPKLIKVTRGFWISKTEVTQAQWMAVVNGENPSDNKDCGPDCAVNNVSYREVRDHFLTRFNAHMSCYPGMEPESIRDLRDLPAGCYRLPTEAEWMFATEAYDDKQLLINASKGKNIPNHNGVIGGQSGVWEWVLDNFDSDYVTNLRSGIEDPLFLKMGKSHFFKGSTMDRWPEKRKKAFFKNVRIDFKSKYVGFRLVRTDVPANLARRKRPSVEFELYQPERILDRWLMEFPDQSSSYSGQAAAQPNMVPPPVPQGAPAPVNVAPSEGGRTAVRTVQPAVFDVGGRSSSRSGGGFKLDMGQGGDRGPRFDIGEGGKRRRPSFQFDFNRSVGITTGRDMGSSAGGRTGGRRDGDGRRGPGDFGGGGHRPPGGGHRPGGGGRPRRR